jgi:hypothetical protein
LAVARNRQSFTEIGISHRQWIEWCRQQRSIDDDVDIEDDENESIITLDRSARIDDVSLLAPKLAVQLKFSPTKDR